MGRGQVFRIMARRHQNEACVQSVLAPGQEGSEHYLVAFYNKFSAAAGLFFWHSDSHGAKINR